MNKTITKVDSEKASEIVIKIQNSGSLDYDGRRAKYMYESAMAMAEWKDEQHQQAIIDLNCKLEEQQACYEELKRRYDESVERERIATKIINELRTRK